MSIRRICCVVVIVLMLFNVAFATTQPINTKNYPIEMISPTLSQKGEVFIDKNLQISVRLESDKPMVMSLTKIETAIVDLNQLSELKTTSLLLNAPQFSTLDKMKSYVEMLSAFNEGTEAEQLKLKKQTLDAYDLIFQDYILKKSRADALLVELKAKFGPTVLTIAAEKPGMDSRFPQLIKFYEEYKVIEGKYRLIKPLYDKLFERAILREIPVELEGIMPYFNFEVKDLKSGKYRLDFFFQSNLVKAVSTLPFDIKSRQETVLSILNGIQAEIDEIWKIKQ